MSREVRRSALVAVPITRMFEVIDRVEDYPAFLPWCVAANDVERSESLVAATVEVGWKHLHFKVRTRNPKTAPTQMEIHLEDGSFRHFSGRWDLKPLGERGCRVDFLLSYELAIPGAAAVAGAAIDHAADRMVDAFLQRAEALALAPASASTDKTENNPRAEPALQNHRHADREHGSGEPTPQNHRHADRENESGEPFVARALPASVLANTTEPHAHPAPASAPSLSPAIPAAGGSCQDAPPAGLGFSRSTSGSAERS